MPFALHGHVPSLTAGRGWTNAHVCFSYARELYARRGAFHIANAEGDTLIIRQASQDDVQAMHAISNAGHIGWSFQHLQAELELDFSTVLVSASEADIEGFACGWHVCEELQVMALAVSQARRREGIGRALLEELLSHGRRLGNSSAFLEFRASNEAAVNLYLTAGFEQIGRRNSYYEDGEAAILMSRVL